MRFNERIATIMATTVMMAEMAPVMARLPDEKMAPMSGVIRVVPQVGQPAPSAMRPVMMPAFSMLAELDVAAPWRFLCQRSTMRPMRVLWRIVMKKVKSQSRIGTLIPKIPRKASRMSLRLFGKPSKPIISKFVVPAERKLSKVPKIRNDGMKPIQKRFSLVVSKMPLPAKTKPSNHFLQFMVIIITYFYCTYFYYLICL